MIIQRAFMELYPEKYEGRYNFELKYSGRFKGYNANVRYKGNSFCFCLSRLWEEVDDNIKIGLIQHLFNKAFRTKRKTVNIELYDLFLKNIHLAVPKDRINESLRDSFDRVNSKYFHGMLTMTNLVWGSHSVRKLGCYDYGTDTITISRVLDDDEDVLDYVMYHEMLHKKIKFKTKNNRSSHHSSEFRLKEKEFENLDFVERKLNKIIRKHRFSKRWQKGF